jgi:hypothetical protein
VSFIVCVVLCAVFRLIVVLFCVMCVICLLCLIVNHFHRVKTHLQLTNITLRYIMSSYLHRTRSFLRSRQLLSFARNSRPFKTSECSLLCPQKPVTDPHTEPDKFSSYFTPYLFKIHFNAILSLFLSGLRETCMQVGL